MIPLAALPIVLLASTGVRPQQPPNIVILYADDLGYGDVATYNPSRGKIPTPHIDALAATGMRFTDAHSSSGVCSPSRYTLLTGRYHWRSRLQRGIVNKWGKPLIAANRATIASLLDGYTTACIGKWHLGWDWPMEAEDRKFFQVDRNAKTTTAHRDAWQRVFSQPIGGGPTTRGFDRYFGTDVPNWPPFCFIQNDRTVGIPSELLPSRMLRHNLASQQGPALADWRLEPILPTLANRATQFIASAAKTEQPYFLYLPFTSPHTPLAVNRQWVGKSGLGPYADLVMETDAAVGQILAAIEASGESENTVVVFTSDNGCAHYIGAKKLEASGHFPSGPLRGYKSDVWEGGHRVPFLVRWPGVTSPGSICTQLVHQADLLATCASIAGVELPNTAGEDSHDLRPLLAGGDEPVREHAVSQSIRGLLAIRRGPWKLIFGPGSGGWTKGSDEAPAQLYHLGRDLGEQDNRYQEEPDIVGELTALMQRLVATGRSTPGPAMENDVPVRWRQFLGTRKKDR